jgi:hypothetical protein
MLASRVRGRVSRSAQNGIRTHSNAHFLFHCFSACLSKASCLSGRADLPHNSSRCFPQSCWLKGCSKKTQQITHIKAACRYQLVSAPQNAGGKSPVKFPPCVDESSNSCMYTLKRAPGPAFCHYPHRLAAVQTSRSNWPTKWTT